VKLSAFGRSSIPRSSLCQSLCGKNRRRRVLPVSSWEFELRRVPRSLLETHAATPHAPSAKHPPVRYESSAPSLATFRPRPTPQSKNHCAERGHTPHTIRPSPPLRVTNSLKTRASKPLVPQMFLKTGNGHCSLPLAWIPIEPFRIRIFCKKDRNSGVFDIFL
jgi:hypothetical protein